ncbi:TNF receptor-associated factor 3-like [Ornithodoros turicata]|uniref:TNF receptor-associated factor 3-like n=1 Tax=Ornithodoros turicata TaxID=34597 RepID=UPI003138EC0C
MTTSERRLVGFSEALDWRSMNFMDLISLRGCSLCSVVPQVTYVLECSHALCELCYHNVRQGERRCPLDDEDFEEINTSKLILKPGQIWKQKARCCNFKDGCDFVGTVEEVKQHFFNHCTFHAVTCSRCQVKVLRKEIVDHYVQECRSRDAVCSSTNVMEMGRKIDVSLGIVADRLAAVENQLHSHAITIGTTKHTVVSNGVILKEFVERQERIANHDSLGTVKDTLHGMMEHIEELTVFLRTIKDASSYFISENAAAPVEQSTTISDNEYEVGAIQNSPSGTTPGTNDHTTKLKEIIKVALGAYKQVTSFHEMLSEMYQFCCLKGSVAYFHFDYFAARRKESLNKQVQEWSGVFVLHGYSCRLHVQMGTCNGDLYLGVFLCICQSSNDSLLRWPFTYPCTLMLVHPTDETKNVEHHIDVLKHMDEHSDVFSKPVGDRNPMFGTPVLCKLQDVVKGGFVHNDSITVSVRIP